MIDPDALFKRLFAAYGEQGWWPLGGAYHPGMHGFPHTETERWEILCGAVLTQNTAWTNVEKALANLKTAGIGTPQRILALENGELAGLIRPSGFFNQKAVRLKTLAGFLATCSGIPDRDALLALDGIGPETADSMLLYAWKQSRFVVDAYTARILSRTGLISPGTLPFGPRKRYEHVQNFITTSLAIPPEDEVRLFSEYHALILRHAKSFCAVKPRCAGCPLEHACRKML